MSSGDSAGGSVGNQHEVDAHVEDVDADNSFNKDEIKEEDARRDLANQPFEENDDHSNRKQSPEDPKKNALRRLETFESYNFSDEDNE